MKKTFKIALLLCLLIAMLLPMASCLKLLPLWRAVAVDTLNGMNAAQLYKKFVNDFKSSSTCEIQFNRTYFSTSTTIKANENAFHYFSKKTSEIDYYPVEFYLFDDFAYLRRETHKYKCHRADVDDLFGENCIDSYYKDNKVYCGIKYTAPPKSTHWRTKTTYFDCCQDTGYTEFTNSDGNVVEWYFPVISFEKDDPSILSDQYIQSIGFYTLVGNEYVELSYNTYNINIAPKNEKSVNSNVWNEEILKLLYYIREGYQSKDPGFVYRKNWLRNYEFCRFCGNFCIFGFDNGDHLSELLFYHECYHWFP